jgi:hypothetical protein
MEDEFLHYNFEKGKQGMGVSIQRVSLKAMQFLPELNNIT